MLTPRQAGHVGNSWVESYCETETERQTDLLPLPAVIAEAVKVVSHKELSYSKAAEKYEISLQSLKRYYELLQNFRQEEKLMR
ncbi:hypothetical protein AVEN_255430-1 [Araneus ventricosus]|uniref:HTH psq-type domain-containing protein n=1 Tax=Araneus ventricosus TaxID=182803 RepID=A0A4Y2HPH7_ARAVE|nr:hypothetical protein AVEN_255430-1 [Araneus ventricosus]